MVKAHRFCCGFVFFVLHQFAVAQSDTVDVLEFTATYPTDQFMLNLLGKEGFVMSKPQKSLLSHRPNYWKCYKFNTNLQCTDSITLETPKKLYLTAKTQHRQKIYYLFYHYKREEIKIVEVNGADLKYQVHHLLALPKLIISNFIVVDDVCYLVGDRQNFPIILHFNLKSKPIRIKVVAASMDRKSRLASINVNRKNNEIYVAVIQQKSRRMAFKVMTFNLQTAQLKNEYVLRQDKRLMVLDVKLQVIDSTHYLSGLYAHSFSSLPEGFFVAKFQAGKQRFLRFHKYTDLEHFFDYLPDKQKNKLKQKYGKLKNYAHPMRSLIRRPFIYKDTIFITGEGYYPIYRQDNSLSQFSMWHMPIRAGAVSDGFVYTHGFVVALDKHGKFIWDNSIKYNYLKDRYLNGIFRLKKSRQRWLLYYGKEAKLYAAHFQKSNTPQGLPVRPMPLLYAQDKIRKAFQTSVFNWYGDYFLGTGYRILKNAEKGKREVFYLSKFKF